MHTTWFVSMKPVKQINAQTDKLDKEHVHDAVKIKIFGLCIRGHQFGPKFVRGE